MRMKIAYQTPGSVPAEILAKILGYCDPKSLLNSRLACRGWQAIIDETIGTSVAIGSPTRLYFRSEYPTHFQPVEVIETVGVESCYVGELLGPVGPFKYPQTVRQMVFNGSITPANLHTLLQPLPALTHLTLHYKALETVKITGDTLNSSTLKCLMITCLGIGHEVSSSGVLRMTGNIIRLLMLIRSHQLEVLLIDAINIPAWSRKMSYAVFKALLNHKYTMRNFQFYNCSERLIASKDQTEEDEEHAAVVETFANEDVVSRAIKETVYLKRISYGGKRNMVCCEAWNRFIQAQIALEDLFYMNECKEGCSNCYPCLTRNSESLQKTLFHLNGVDEYGDATLFDCRILKGFKYLTHLLVRGRQEIVTEENRVDDRMEIIARVVVKMALVQNIESIPKIVVVFSLRDVMIKTTELAKLKNVDVLPNLRKFRLSECGSSVDYGIDFDTFKELLTRESIVEMEIIHSFNPLKWEPTDDMDIYDSALMHKVRDEWEFHAQRSNTDQGFRTKLEPMFNYGRFESSLRANDVCEVIFE